MNMNRKSRAAVSVGYMDVVDDDELLCFVICVAVIVCMFCWNIYIYIYKFVFIVRCYDTYIYLPVRFKLFQTY